MGKKRCPYCKKLYWPDPRQKKKQKTCGTEDCQRQRRRENAREWRKKNPGYDSKEYREARQPAHCEWKRKYWASHPEYRLRHSEYMRQWRGMRKLPENRVRVPYRDIELTLSKQSTFIEISCVRVPYRMIAHKLQETKDYEGILRL